MLEFAAAGFQGFQKCTKHAVPSELITMPHGARGGRMFIYVLLNTCQPWVMVSVISSLPRSPSLMFAGHK